MRCRAGLICSWGVHVARHVASNGRKLTPTNHDREAAEAVRGVVLICGRLVARDQRRVRFAGDRGLAGDRGRGGGRCREGQRQLLTQVRREIRRAMLKADILPAAAIVQAVDSYRDQKLWSSAISSAAKTTCSGQ